MTHARWRRSTASNAILTEDNYCYRYRPDKRPLGESEGAFVKAGFGLAPTELVDRLLATGVPGWNLEDSDDRADRVLVDSDLQASYIADVRAASEKAGVHIVVNARTDAFIRRVGDERAQLDEALSRGRLYLEAPPTASTQ